MSITTGGESNGRAFIGVDVGGTHTDVSIVYEGTVERGKALTTYDDFSRGVLEAAIAAALAIAGLLLLLGLAAPVAVVFAIAFAPVALGLACAGAWMGMSR